MFSFNSFTWVVGEVFLYLIVICVLTITILLVTNSPGCNHNYNTEYQIYNKTLPPEAKIIKALGKGWFVVEIEDTKYLMLIKGSIVLKIVRE